MTAGLSGRGCNRLATYLTCADELCVSLGLVYKGHCLVVPSPARAEILHRIDSAHGDY